MRRIEVYHSNTFSPQVLSKDSANLLNSEENKYPGPMTEIKFWEAKCMNLESLYEQMKAQTTKNMASILESTDSAYYPVFRSMFRGVLFVKSCQSGALNDIYL